MKATVKGFFDPGTWTVTYVVFETPGGPCTIIDSVLDYDPKSGRTATRSADQVIAFIESQALRTEWILETHAHADHISAAHYLQSKLGGKTVIGNHISTVQSVFKKIFHLGDDFHADGTQFDRLLADGEEIPCGGLTIQAIYVPGHTPACVAYVIGDAIFVGDTMFMPDVGTARCDFPGGDAKTLFRSVQRILAYPPETRLFMCHDYPPDERAIQYECTVADQRRDNIHVNERIAEADFVAMRSQRDAGLEMPVLIIPSIQVNIRAGVFPAPEDNGVVYLKTPLNLL